MAIQLKNVSKIYRMGDVEVNALNQLNISVKKGSFTAIIGPSGSGKSTAMNIIGSLDTPTEGNVLISGTNIKDFNQNQLAAFRGKKIGFVFQHFNLIPSLTALENVMIPMLFQGVPLNERMKRAEELLTNIGLGDRMNHLPKELSGGQMQRVAIARALANNPEIILADEPTGNLDSKTGQEILALLKNLNKKGKTIVVITHDEDIKKYCNVVHYIKDGKLEKTWTKR
ncbi:ABC transporter ATP-binding protein [Candidatus Pacearchaeota archaeon]|nr:ABC transporter ATP-binding protein [Candidatus Pacearchaeota archaeon]